jgi:hypothetical protein
MPADALLDFLKMLAKAGNQRATADALGCSLEVVRRRMAGVRKELGDTEVLARLNEYALEAGTGKRWTKLDNKKSLTCNICSIPKKESASGQLVCLSCSNRQKREYKQRHPDRVGIARADYRERNREVLREKLRDYRVRNPGLDAAYYRANAERVKAGVRAYRAANADKVAIYFRALDQTPARQAQNRARLRAWKKAHPDRVNADTARRQLRLYQAYPAWADDSLIAEFYALARLRSAVTGIPWEVDHIVPLNCDLVCGLHWEGNLQVIPAAANLAKSNDWWPDMPAAPAPLVAFFERPSLYVVAPARACLPAPASLGGWV